MELSLCLIHKPFKKMKEKQKKTAGLYLRRSGLRKDIYSREGLCREVPKSYTVPWEVMIGSITNIYGPEMFRHCQVSWASISSLLFPQHKLILRDLGRNKW